MEEPKICDPGSSATISGVLETSTALTYENRIVTKKKKSNAANVEPPGRPTLLGADKQAGFPPCNEHAWRRGRASVTTSASILSSARMHGAVPGTHLGRDYCSTCSAAGLAAAPSKGWLLEQNVVSARGGQAV